MFNKRIAAGWFDGVMAYGDDHPLDVAMILRKEDRILKVLNGNDIKRLINMDEALERVEKVFVQYSAGETVMPQRPNIGVEDHYGNLLFMPAYIKGSEYLGCKIVSVYPNNPAKGKKTIYSVLVLNDSSTGEPIAIMDAELITAYRTGAVTGVAAKYLAVKDAETVSIWGGGVQAKQQLEAICKVRNIRKVFVFDINKDNRERFVEEMKASLGINVVGADDEEEAVSQSDILITATTSSKPVFKTCNLKPGAFVSAIGGSTQQKQEIPETVMNMAKIIVDGYGAAMVDAGDIVIPMSKGLITRNDIKGELGEVITGKVVRNSDDEIILFKSVGLAIQDITVASWLYEQSLKENIGSIVEL